ncbi:hypothetical protein C8C98_2106 [Acidovorax sp. 106]|nr:hypothetical protein C8C98_2106 [Acidovorax sp. 106]
MTIGSIKRWTCVLTAVTALVVGCGGSGETAPVAKTDAVSSVDSRVQPVNAVQKVESVKFRSGALAPKATEVSLPALSQAKSIAASAGAGARQVGEVRSLNATWSSQATQAYLDWQVTANGGRVAAISFRAEGAYGLRLGVLVNQLPGGATLRVYAQSSPDKVFEISGHDVLQTVERNQAAGDLSDAGRTWWTPDTGAAEATLEIELPPGIPAAAALNVAVPHLSHIYENLALPTAQEYEEQVQVTKDIGDSDFCNTDATCSTSLTVERNSVARMIFVRADGRAYLCTGTLLNDVSSSGRPYFLSANHCVSDQTVASTLQTDWFFRSPRCNSGSVQSSTTKRSRGAQLLYVSSETDTSFMLLNDTPPAGATFAGWGTAPVDPGAAVVGLHHPSGDLLKISNGVLVGQTNCVAEGATGFRCSGTAGNFYRVTWSQGVTEGGSSGSAIFQNSKVVGTLYGGSTACTVSGGYDYYGRFDIAYSAALKTWLAAAASAERVAVYRFYNAKTGAHFYTASASERDFVIRTYPEFAYETEAFYVYPDASTGKEPVFRFYNATSGAHFYAGSAAERDLVISRFPDFRYEIVSWYSQVNSGNAASPVYRFYNSKTGAHFYTISALERDLVIQVHTDFRYEGPTYYAWTSK